MLSDYVTAFYYSRGADLTDFNENNLALQHCYTVLHHGRLGPEASEPVKKI